MVPAGFAEEILPLLAGGLGALVAKAVPRLPGPLEEIRIREGRPLQLIFCGGDLFVAPDGSPTAETRRGFLSGRDDVARTFQLMTSGSVYAWEDEVRSGYLTLRGGHRVGLAGRALTESGQIRTIRQVTSLNIRVAREVPGCATPVLTRILRQEGQVRPLSTLIISPPGAGKTTLLRDLVRQISTGVPALGLPGCKVVLVDERSEVAGCHDGVPQRDVGPRTDVLDACAKAEGMMLLIRAMSPQVVAVDEIGRLADTAAALEALHAGVTVLATAHGEGIADVRRRPAVAELLAAGAFQRAAVLSRSRGPGTVEQVIDLTGEGGGLLAG